MRLNLSRFNSRSKRSHRAAYWLLLIVLTLQLIGMAFHHHDLADNDSDCVSCYLSVHVPTTIPPITIDLVAVTLFVLRYQIASLPIYRFVAAQSYLIPLPLAPPQVLIPA